MDDEVKTLLPALNDAILSHLQEGRLPCATAFALAQEWGRKPDEVAAAAEGLGIRIGWCQLGLFQGGKKHGPRPAPQPTTVPADLQAAILAGLEEGQLPCARAWAIAHRLGLERREVGQAADALGVRIGRCQLGCFS